jgi:hypothetical protein
VQIRLTNRTALRVDPLEYFHVSNGYLAASNPGFDELGARLGISSHLGKPEQQWPRRRALSTGRRSLRDAKQMVLKKK